MKREYFFTNFFLENKIKLDLKKLKIMLQYFPIGFGLVSNFKMFS